jgi:hypothetical protein
MTISELIQNLTELKAEHGDMEVVLSVNDHTDYTYNFEHPGFDIGPVYDEEFESEDEDGNEIDYCVCEISI